MDIGLVDAAFWAAAAALVYTYAGYPALLAALSLQRKQRTVQHGTLPSVSMIVAAYNEDRCIAEKIADALDHDCEVNGLEVIVVSDGSTDQTESEVRHFADRRVRLLVQSTRLGKNMALNRAARDATGELLVFSDANTLLAPGALRRLVALFADPVVGLVSGQGLYGGLGSETTRSVSNAYVRYESFIKQRESDIGFVVAADGALYAMRRELYRELRPTEAHDLLHPIQVALAGGRSRFEPAAYTIEPSSRDSAEEFRRHVRIIAQGLLVLMRQAPILLFRRRFKELWMLVSHRFMRWTSAFFLLTVLLTNLALWHTRPIYAVTLGGQLLFYGLALAGAIGERRRVHLRLLGAPYYFCVVSAAGITGLLRFLRGHGHATWVPAGR